MNEYPVKFLEGLQLYQDGKFWESHESWEELWREATGAERSFLQALIQLDAAILHTQRQHWQGVWNLLSRALKHLHDCPREVLGVDVKRLIDEIGIYRSEIESVRDGKKTEFDWTIQPKLELKGVL